MLELLKASAGTMELSGLQGNLYAFGYALLIEDIMPEIRYLTDAGYTRIDKKFGGTIIEISITKKGDDLVNCIIDEDPGVLISRCERPYGK
jgi:hypothetical protein